VSLCFVILAGTALPKTACPVENTIAYSRDTTSGIPPGARIGDVPQPPVSTAYFIYLVVKKDTRPNVKCIWLKGKHYAVTLQKVESPVLVEREPAVPTGEKHVLVPATSSDVYELQLGNESDCCPNNNDEKRLTQNNELVVFLRVGRSTRYCPVETLTRLPPVAGQ
jgi:hypothetical protein